MDIYQTVYGNMNITVLSAKDKCNAYFNGFKIDMKIWTLLLYKIEIAMRKCIKFWPCLDNNLIQFPFDSCWKTHNHGDRDWTNRKLINSVW